MTQSSQKNQKKHFCAKAFGGLSISPSGSLAPCCLFEQAILREDGTPYSIWKDNLDEAYNSAFMVDFRHKMLRDEAVEACRQCYQVEEHGGYSMRLQSNESPFEMPKDFGLRDQVPVSLDLKLNNRCNLKCRMCQPRDSHLIYDEFLRIQNEDENFSNFSNTDMIDPDLQIPLDQVPNWPVEPAFKKTFREMIPSIRKIALVGGEPLLLDELYDTLDMCIEEDAAKDIFLVITSNFMHVPVERLAPMLNIFKRTLFNISLDAVGTELNYIRYPSNFTRITQNFKKLYDAAPLDKVFFQFSPTVQVYNVIYLHQVYHFVEELLVQGVKLSPSALHVTFLEFPSQLNIRALPQSTRDIALKRLNAIFHECPRLMALPIVKRNLQQTIDILQGDFVPNAEKLMGEFMYYSNAIDRQRGQRMQDFLPELYESVKDIKPVPPPSPYFKMRAEAERLLEREMLPEAAVCFEKSAQSSPDSFVDYRAIARIKLRLHELQKSSDNRDLIKEAISALKKAHASSLDKYIDLREIAWTKLRLRDFQNTSHDIGILQEAIHCFELASKTSPDKFIDLREMAWMKLIVGDFEGAYDNYVEGTALNPDDRFMAKGLVLAQVAAGHSTDFDKRLALALSLNPQDDELLKVVRP